MDVRAALGRFQGFLIRYEFLLRGELELYILGLG
jgi:hypothetical protein